MKHPYSHAPKYTKWRSAVGETALADVDPVVEFPFKIRRSDQIATAGSCFAQHIARAISSSGFNYYVAEPGHAFISDVANQFGYGLFSARYGNIYTTRQLRQLIERALGLFDPQVKYWESTVGRFYDPFRPTVQPGGFRSYAEMRADVKQHLNHVRTMIENLDYFVFTLGLTECWASAADGAVYPICPGVAAGEFNPEYHKFNNFGVDEVYSDLVAALELIRALNPRARVILTVSPVALAATAEDRHVITSTTYSKAVLRVVAERAIRTLPFTAYFPSYEIITGSFNRTSYLADDLREVNAQGVAHVMRLFMKHATDPHSLASPDIEMKVNSSDMIAAAGGMLQAECDEALLGR